MKFGDKMHPASADSFNRRTPFCATQGRTNLQGSIEPGRPDLPIRALVWIGMRSGGFELVVLLLALNEITEEFVFPASRFEIKDKIFNTESKIVEVFGEAVDHFLHSGLALLGILGEVAEAILIGGGKVIDFLDEVIEFLLEVLVTHDAKAPVAFRFLDFFCQHPAEAGEAEFDVSGG